MGSLVFQTTVTLFAIDQVRFEVSLIVNLSINEPSIFQINFIPGYFLLILDAFQIFIPCLLGTYLEEKCGRYFEKICSISWIELPVSDQKSVIMILSSARQVKSIFFSIMKLNLNSFVQVAITAIFLSCIINEFNSISDLQNGLFILYASTEHALNYSNMVAEVSIECRSDREESI